MQTTPIKKYGKDIDIRAQNRDLSVMREIIDFTIRKRERNLVPYDPAETYPCRICQSDKHHEFLVSGGYHYHECDNCGSVILLNIPDTKKLYDENEASWAERFCRDDAVFRERMRNTNIPKVRFVLEVIAPPHTHTHTHGGEEYGAISGAETACCLRQSPRLTQRGNVSASNQALPTFCSHGKKAIRSSKGS